MPTKKTYRKKKNYRKKKYNKRFKKATRAAVSQKGMQLKFRGKQMAPLPDTYMTVLRYKEFYSQAAAGTGTGVYDNVFAGNIINAPGGTLTPAGLDEFNAIYATYRVYASKIKVWVKSLANATTGADDFIVTLMPTRNSLAWLMTDVNENLSAPYATTGMVNRGANGNTPTIVKQFRKTKDIFGESDIDDDEYAGDLPAGSPTNQWFWHVALARNDRVATADSPGFNIMIEIKYYVRFERRRTIGQGTI